MMFYFKVATGGLRWGTGIRIRDTCHQVTRQTPSHVILDLHGMSHNRRS